MFPIRALALPADFSNMRYMQKSIFASLFFFIFVPAISHASVMINEIAWMGTETSGSDEWIELYNNGNASADLSQWMLEAEDGSPAIALSGSINAGAYFLIERTDDTTVPDIPADLIAPFGNGLSNAGETLYLKRADGSVEDTLRGGEDWENIGGDNNTKQTAQRTSSGWITATATPRAENFAPPVSLPESEEVPASSGSASAIAPPPASSGSAKPSPYPRKEIIVFAGDDERAFVNFPVQFSGKAFGLYDEALSYANYRWNFGDGMIGEGQAVTHSYRFPGEYIATLSVSWGSNTQIDRRVIMVVEPQVVIVKVVSGEEGFVELKNSFSREIDLSGWRLESAAKEFFLPPNTVVLSGKSLTLPNAHTGLFETGGRIALLYPNETEAYVWNVVFENKNPPSAVRGASTQKANVETTAPKVELPEEKEVRAEGSAAVVLWEREANAPVAFAGMNALLLFGGMLLVIAAGLFFYLRRIKALALPDDYLIAEEIIEGGDDEIRKN